MTSIGVADTTTCSSDYELVVDRVAGLVDVAFTIVEGRQSVIADIIVEGNRKTTEHLVREQVELLETELLDLSALARSRRNLYDTGAFSIVDITREDLEGDVPAASGFIATRRGIQRLTIRSLSASTWP